MDYSFLEKPTLEVAKELLGKELIHNSPYGVVSGIIVETEAYLQDDSASHSYVGQTHRNTAMFGAAGTLYLYKSYGIHTCLNIVTSNLNIGEAVLIRALQPIQGIEIMKKLRNKNNIKQLCNGPGKLTQALAIPLTLNATTLLESPLSLSSFNSSVIRIQNHTRIGISKNKDKLYRFSIQNNQFISKL